MTPIILFFVLWNVLVPALAQNDTTSTQGFRNKKELSVFQVVKFPNSVCTGTGSYNGTCYTSSECSNKGGTSSGSCASGFGVCCVFVLSCGGSASDNCSYIVQSSTTSLTSPCTYSICPCSTSICRIRFDFTTFVLADPPSFTVQSASSAAGNAEVSWYGGAIGDCNTDAFSVTAPGMQGTPVICGFNTGQHMIVDANSLCHKVNFNIGSSTATSRSWNIKVTQYACGSEFLGGPPQCLQYFTGKTGTISSYNFPTTSSSVGATATHLNNQCYQICIRRESGICYICYTPTISTGPATTAQASFGLSISLPIAADGATATVSYDTYCSTDYLSIPGGTSAAIATITYTTGLPSTSPSLLVANRICGRIFTGTITPGTASTLTTTTSICSRQVPFRMTFKTNTDEQSYSKNMGLTAASITNESVAFPSGTIGFSLKYVQNSC